MVAGLLYLAGLVVVVANILVIGYGVPSMVQTFTAAMDAGSTNMFGVVTSLATSVSWPLTLVVGGLLVMGVGRIIILLSAINRSLRGQG